MRINTLDYNLNCLNILQLVYDFLSVINSNCIFIALLRGFIIMGLLVLLLILNL